MLNKGKLEACKSGRFVSLIDRDENLICGSILPVCWKKGTCFRINKRQSKVPALANLFVMSATIAKQRVCKNDMKTKS